MLSAEVMEMNIAIYGAGSLGTIMGAYLSETYPVVDLIDTNKEHVTQLNEKGAHVVASRLFCRKRLLKRMISYCC